MATTFEDLVALAYDAPLAREGWKPLLRALRDRTGSRAVCLKWLARDAGSFHMVHVGLGPAAVSEYGARFGGLDVWSRVPLAADADVFGDDMVPRATLEASEFYQDFCRAHDIADIHKTMLGRSRGVQVSLGLLKPSRTKRRAREQLLTRALAPHLRRALALASRVTAADHTHAALVDALDLANAAVVFLDRARRVRFCSVAAERIVAGRDGLHVARGALRACDPASDRALQAYLAGAGNHDSVYVRRAAGAPYSVLAVPARTAGIDHGIATLVFVTQTPARRSVAEALRDDFALTAAEVRVALRVGRGATPRQVADELAVSWYTVRAQLREVYAKTGARRQALLVDLIGRLERGERS